MARKTGSINHVHKYFKDTRSGLWHCAGNDGCTHYMPKNMPEPVGRPSKCWSCDKVFQLLPENMKDDKPTCEGCAEKLSDNEQFIEYMFKKAGMDPDATTPLERAVGKQHTIKKENEHRDDCASLYIPGLECDCRDEIE